MMIELRRLLFVGGIVVVTGNWKQSPLPGVKDESLIYLTVDDAPDPNSGGGSSGSLDELFAWLGDSVRLRFVNEIPVTPTGTFSWRDQLGPHKNAMRQATPAGEKAMLRLLENFARQSGLSLQSEERSVEVWRIVAE
jgi:hypothetical protein